MDNHLTHNSGMYGDIKLYAGTAIPEVAQGISDYLNIPLSGRDIIRLFEGNLNAGDHVFEWNTENDAGEKMASGIYFYSYKSDSKIETGKLIIK